MTEPVIKLPLKQQLGVDGMVSVFDADGVIAFRAWPEIAAQLVSLATHAPMKPDQQADDVIKLPLKSENGNIIDADGVVIARAVGFRDGDRIAAALVERVTRQLQELDGELLDRLEELAVWLDENAPVGHSTPWLVRRDVVREAGRQLAASVSHQQEPPQEPVFRRDPCGCLHDGSRIVEWCTRSGQTHEGHEEEQRTTKI